MALAPNNQNQPQNNQFSWTLPAALQLIRERRNLQQQFDAAGTRNYGPLWDTVSQGLQNTIGFAATANQCRTKFNALTRGFDNSVRIAQNNPQGFPITSPNTFDVHLFAELLDQFWKRTGN